MKALQEFIIKLDKPLNDTFKTEAGIELYGHKDFSVDRLSNRIAKVIATPLWHETPIKAGYEVMIEITILYKQSYRGIKQGYTSLIDTDNMLFRITPSMIVLYREDEKSEWKGYLKNVMVERIKENTPKINTNLIIPDNAKDTYKKEYVKLLYGNNELKEMGVENGDEILINPMGGVDFWIDGKHYWWMRSVDVYGVAV